MTWSRQSYLFGYDYALFLIDYYKLVFVSFFYLLNFLKNFCNLFLHILELLLFVPFPSFYNRIYIMQIL